MIADIALILESYARQLVTYINLARLPVSMSKEQKQTLLSSLTSSVQKFGGIEVLDALKEKCKQGVY